MGCGATKDHAQSHAPEMEDGAKTATTLGVVDSECSEVKMDDKELEAQQEALAVEKRERALTGLVARLNAAVSLREMKRYAEALAERKAVVAASRDELGPKHKVTISALGAAGISYCDMEEYEAAEQALTEALEGQRAVFGDRHIKTAETMYWLGQAYYKQGKYAEAVGVAEQCLQVHVRAWPKGDPQIASAERTLAKYKKRTLSRRGSPRNTDLQAHDQ
eukprot:390465-Rhodomonas_salina.1